MLVSGVLALAFVGYLGWWGRPVLGVVSPRIQGYDFYFSSGMCFLFFAAVVLISVGITKL